MKTIEKTTLFQLDQWLKQYKRAGVKQLPSQGWVRTIRKALGMTINQLARRLNVDSSRVVQIEISEPEGAISIASMQKVAKALNCQFVYALVPNDTLTNMVEKQAEKVAKKLIKNVSHNMSLEDQRVSSAFEKQQIKMLMEQLLNKSWKNLWDE